MQITIPQETTADHPTVYHLVRAAFAGAEHSDGNEQDLVVALRRSQAFVPQLSLVAVAGTEVIGHILFTRALVGGATVVALAPLSVHPRWQRQGVGTALITHGHTLAKSLGYGYSLVLGSDAYYSRYGYRPARQFGIWVPAGFPPQNFMAIQLDEQANPISGPVVYAKEFGL